mgnify:CR=1 FL=1
MEEKRLNTSPNNFISVDFNALFLAREGDVIIKKLLQQLKYPKTYFNVKVVVPYNLWHYYSTFESSFFTDAFKSVIDPKLTSVFGQVPIELCFSRLLKGQHVNVAWGANINHQGKYNLTLNKQKIASFDDYCVVDSTLTSSFGIFHSMPFEILVEDGGIELLKGNDDYLVNGLSLIASESTNSIHFRLRKDT